MALVLKASLPDIDALRRDLDSVEIGLGWLVGEVGREKLQPLVAEVQGLMPFDARHRGWPPGDIGEPDPEDPGHIRDSIKGTSSATRLSVATTHPGGPVHWWGGTIRPRGTPIEIHNEAGAGEDFTSRVADEVVRDVEDALDSLLRRHHL